MRNDATRLARRYRLLLLAYPRDYRRHRGEEIVDTLLEMAPAGQHRPTLRQAANLVSTGLRCQLGRPRSNGIVVAAALAAIFAAFLGASAAAWLGWQPARDRDQPEFPHLHAYGARAPTGGRLAGRPDHRARAHDLPGARLQAEKGGLVMTISYDDGVFTVGADNSEIPTPISLDISRATPPWVPAVTALGALLGALAGWLLVGWISRRVAGSPLILQLGVLLFGIVAYGGMLPTVALFALLWPAAMSGPAASGLGIIWFPLTTTLCRSPAVVAALALLVPAAIAALARPPRAAPDSPASA
jgi:hypothetical protein